MVEDYDDKVKRLIEEQVRGISKSVIIEHKYEAIMELRILAHKLGLKLNLTTDEILGIANN